jgi:hypothetical protein
MKCGIGPSEIPNQLNEQSAIQTHLNSQVVALSVLVCIRDRIDLLIDMSLSTIIIRVLVSYALPFTIVTVRQYRGVVLYQLIP